MQVCACYMLALPARWRRAACLCVDARVQTYCCCCMHTHCIADAPLLSANHASQSGDGGSVSKTSMWYILRQYACVCARRRSEARAVDMRASPSSSTHQCICSHAHIGRHQFCV
eukprot:6184900-Pleurochrysis_carterae.AAC.1